METARRSRAQQSAANREAVLAAAERVFAEFGYAAAALDRIAAVAGFTKGAVYSRFGGKADLFLAVVAARIDARARENVGQLDAAFRAGRDPLEALVATMDQRASAEAGWRLALLEFRLIAARDEQLLDRYALLHARTVAGLAALLDELARRREVPLGMPTDALARAVLALDTGAQFEDLTSEPIPAAQRVESLRRLLTPLDHRTTREDT